MALVKNVFQVALLMGVFVGFKTASAVPTCVDYNGRWAGSCTITTMYGSFNFPQRASINFSSDCKLVTLSGFNIFAPGVNNMKVGQEMKFFEYKFAFPGIANHGHQGVTAHFNHAEGKILVVAHNGLLGYTPNGVNARAVFKVPYEFTLNGDELEYEEDQEFSMWGNGGAEMKGFFKNKCKFERQ